MKRKIVIKDGRSDNLYKIEEKGGHFVAHHVRVGILSDRHNRIGAGSTFDEALALVRAHAGTSRMEIKPW